jgi:hypothetical protein|uniref:Uncharacterized protein n=1 Tax=Siphoviridae sp. ctSP74 TaxID=2826343 RepID=A0A8S5NPG2_9CAUD|nr:MAG TPA: hypothetical protein [Siphoviridae sp. ctSP74]DAI37603.1 MAG TPA: hypothetical protein [Caudoviricetes sp.]
MNFREIKYANKLIDEIKKLDSFITDIQNPTRTLTVSTSFNGVTVKKEHRTKIIQVILGMRRELSNELEELGVTEYDDND